MIYNGNPQETGVKFGCYRTPNRFAVKTITTSKEKMKKMENNTNIEFKNKLDILYSDDDTPILNSVFSLSEFLKVINDYGKKTDRVYGYLYRGQRDATWRITSSLTRAMMPPKDIYLENLKKGNIDYIALKDVVKNRRTDIFNAYNIFKSQLPSYLSEVNSKEFLINSDISILLLAQHYGLPTRFIDLTLNPLISLYFAVCGSTPKTTAPAAVFVYDNENYLTGDEFSYAIENIIKTPLQKESVDSDFKRLGKLSSFKFRYISTLKIDAITGNICIEHYSFDKRMQSQECMFLFHNDIELPFIPQKQSALKKIIIENPYEIKVELMRIGFVESRIYPSLSGLTKTLLERIVNNSFNFFLE